MHFRDIRDILVEPADVLVLRDADHLPVHFEDPDTGTWLAGDAAEPEPVHAPGDLVPGDPVLRGPVRPLEVAARCSVRSRSCFFLFGYFVFDRLRDTFAEEV